jgi:hypothetical protein
MMTYSSKISLIEKENVRFSSCDSIASFERDFFLP